MARPDATDYAPFYHHYVTLAAGDDALKILSLQQDEIIALLEQITPQKANYAYAPGKWTFRELLQHIIDAERVFAFRALWFARGATDVLPGYDENLFADEAQKTLRSLEELKEELIVLRKTTIHLFEGFSAELLQRGGTASGAHVTVNALGFIIAGHFYHHRNIINERYIA